LLGAVILGLVIWFIARSAGDDPPAQKETSTQQAQEEVKTQKPDDEVSRPVVVEDTRPNNQPDIVQNSQNLPDTGPESILIMGFVPLLVYNSYRYVQSRQKLAEVRVKKD